MGKIRIDKKRCSKVLTAIGLAAVLLFSESGTKKEQKTAKAEVQLVDPSTFEPKDIYGEKSFDVYFPTGQHVVKSTDWIYQTYLLEPLEDAQYFSVADWPGYDIVVKIALANSVNDGMVHEWLFSDAYCTNNTPVITPMLFYEDNYIAVQCGVPVDNVDPNKDIIFVFYTSPDEKPLFFATGKVADLYIESEQQKINEGMRAIVRSRRNNQ